MPPAPSIVQATSLLGAFFGGLSRLLSLIISHVLDRVVLMTLLVCTTLLCGSLVYALPPADRLQTIKQILEFMIKVASLTTSPWGSWLGWVLFVITLGLSIIAGVLANQRIQSQGRELAELRRKNDQSRASSRDTDALGSYQERAKTRFANTELPEVPASEDGEDGEHG